MEQTDDVEELLVRHFIGTKVRVGLLEFLGVLEVVLRNGVNRVVADAHIQVVDLFEAVTQDIG